MTAGYCDSGNCLHVETDGASTVLYESAQPDIRVVTTTASWQAQLDQAKAEERAAIVAYLRVNAERHLDGFLADWSQNALGFADLIERREFAGLVAGDE